jgi:hypothetical protein
MHPLSQRFRSQAQNVTPHCAALLSDAADELDRLYAFGPQECPDTAALELENAALREQVLTLMCRVDAYEPTLRLIACGPRPDGTYNHDRASCKYLAEKALTHE